MHTRNVGSGLAVLLSLAAALGCGDDDATPADDGGGDRTDVPDVPETGDDGGGEADSAMDDGGPNGTLSVVVMTSDWLAADERTPAEGAAVALDMPGGMRVEEVTGADGRITFEGLDWSLGTASVTGYLEGYAAGSWVGVEERTEDLVVNLVPLAPPIDFVTVSGTALNMPPAALELMVTATIPGGQSNLTPPGWSLGLEPGLPFTLLAAARHYEPSTGVRERAWLVDAWLALDHAAVTGPTTIDLDFATPVVPLTVSGSLPLPTDPDSRLHRQATGWGFVGSLNGAAVPGLMVHTILSADGNSIEYDIEYLEVPGLERVATVYNLVITDQVFSQVIVQGYPTAGAQDLDFLELPQLVSPPDSRTSHPLHDPIVFATTETGVGTNVWISRDAVGIWWVSDESGATTLTVPELPSTVDAAAFLGDGPVQGSITVGQNLADSVYFERSASIGPITLQP